MRLACDVVINHFSTIAVEASIFDKPALQMWYFLKPNGAMRFPPVYLNWPSCFHTRRLLSYGATPVVESREALMDGIREALDEPAKRAAERARLVEREVGALDGKALERMVAACGEEYKRFKSEEVGT